MEFKVSIIILLERKLKKPKQNKQTKLLFTHNKLLDTVALQISKEMLFEAGKSNCIKNNENSQPNNKEANL